jgi:predicted phosphodiesterase
MSAPARGFNTGSIDTGQMTKNSAKPLAAFAATNGELSEQQVVELAEKAGYIVHKPQPPREPIRFDPARIKGKQRVRLAVASDTHFGSKFQQPSYLKEHYRYFKKRGVDAILLPGDITDGSPSMHPGFVYETWAHGADAQKEAALDSIPDIGVPQFVIAGNHDASHFKAGGHDVVKAICDQRADLNYIGPEITNRNFRDSIGYIEFGEVLVQMCHPHMPGTRTRSYRLETWIENIMPPRPHMVAMGNFHKPVEINFRNTWGVMLPAFQGQTGWMASKAIQSYVGSCILEFGTTTKGIAPSMSVEWLLEYEPRRADYPGGER